MPIEPLQVWKDEFEKLPKVKDPSWAQTMANWYADMIAGIEPDPTILNSPGFTFTYNPAIFAAAMVSIPPSVDPVSGVALIATAWESSMVAAIALALPGTILLPPSPATTFSVVTSTLIDPPSILAAKATLLGLATAPKTNKGNDSQYPVKLREATLQLTITISGMNSVVPTPAPLVAASIPLI
jgi:hypothetical protein